MECSAGVTPVTLVTLKNINVGNCCWNVGVNLTAEMAGKRCATRHSKEIVGKSAGAMPDTRFLLQTLNS